ncbi:MAG: hypothetical protein SGILL_004573 [Bacillariaceae sp.]
MQKHQYKVRNYDAVLAKLAQTEEELRAANRVSYGGEAKPRTETTVKKPPSPQPVADTKENSEDADGVASELQAPATEATPVQPQPAQADSGSAPEQTPETAIEPVTGAEELKKEKMIEETKPDIPTEGESAGETLKAAIAAEHDSPVAPEEASAPAPNADDATAAEPEEDKKPSAVELIEEEESPKVATEKRETKKNEEEKPSLFTMDVEPLMEIFGYLDPMDILNTAQINMRMYTKVDNIFGISEDGQSPPAPTPTPKPAQAPPAPTAQPAPAKVATKTAPSTADTTKPEPTHKKSNSGPLGMGLLSMMQPKPQAAQAATSAAATTKPISASSASHSQPLNAKVAQSMAAKLSDAELAAIISMTDKLSKLEKEVHALRNDKEVIAAKLDGTENVKQFLIGKVRDVEVKLQRSKEDEIKVTQQIASDQEVIAFLDSRVQELEQQTVDLTKENSIMQAELDSLKGSTSKKITMLNDMLKYEREKVREDEGEWKATKKVLVKEVKSCRAQILTLQAERDGLKGQNEMLNRAINSSSNGSSNRSPGRARRKNT